jgi:aspartyl/asparaginyl beta-hydroxylase (cupin superfamily)
MPELHVIPFWDTKQFVSAKILENNAEIIKNELLALRDTCGGFIPIGDAFNCGSNNNNLQNNWKSYHFFWDSREFKENTARCPKTTQIIRSLPDFFGWAFFSAINPGTHIPAHRGPFNLKLTCHLGLVGLDGCKFRCNDKMQKWEDGKTFIFDDSLEHEAWNNGKQQRIVLIVDLFHPDLTESERTAIKYYFDEIIGNNSNNSNNSDNSVNSVNSNSNNLLHKKAHDDLERVKNTSNHIWWK